MDNQIMKKNTFFKSTVETWLNKLRAKLLLATAVLFSGSVLAVDIAQSPLFLNKSATPNIMFVLDDSGSMDWDILTLPHFEASNYDRDFNRSWARGGWLAWDDRNRSKRSNGDWVSYAGYCHDRNADGICYNRLDLDGDGDTNDSEKAGNEAKLAEPNWRLRLNHWYYYEYTQGYCWEPSAGSSDATDYLPTVDNILAFLTGSSNAQAHTYNGTSWGGANDPGHGDFADTDSAYVSERWRHRGGNYDVGDWANNPSQATDKATCLSVAGNQWKRSNTGRILHHGPDQHSSLRTTSHPTWTSDAWVGPASVIDATTGVLTRGAGGSDGGYHSEYKDDDGKKAVAETGSLDINGDGDTGDTGYHEKDGWGVKRVIYHYIDEQKDNVYLNSRGPFGNNTKPWESCSQSDLDSSANSCNHLQYSNYPNDYPYDPLNSAVAATSQNLAGNENIVTLPSFVPRAIKATWGNPPSSQVRFDTIPWAGAITPAGTHHAMNKWDKWPLISDWRVRSASLNVLYYSPETEYTPWPGLVDASFNAAKSNPQPSSVGYSETKNLVRPHVTVPLVSTVGVPYQHATEAGFVYEIWHDDAGFWSNSPQWNASTTCGIPTTSTGKDVNGWKASYYNGRYGATVRSVVLGTVDPATGHEVIAGDRICSTFNNKPNGIVDLWDKHDRVTVYTDKIVVETVRRTPHIMGERFNTDSSKKVLVSDTRILNRVIYDAGITYPVDGFCETVLGKDPDNSANCRTVAQVQQNAANWYEFSRRRSFVAKGAIASLIETLPDLNYGLMGTSRSDTVGHNKVNDVDLSIDISKLFRDVYDGSGSGNGNVDRAIHNEDLTTSLYNHVFRRSGTPLRQALQRAGEYFAGRGPLAVNSGDADDHNTSPITESCQKNFAVMLTDGYWSGLIPADLSGTDGSGNTVTLTNADGDSYDRTLADVAKHYYDEDLHSTLPNEVPTDTFDTNDAQHLSTIGIGFGVTGSKVDTDNDGWPNPVLTEASDWGNPLSNNSNKINDLWHAAYNSRGLYLNAKNPAELIARLNDAILFATSTVGSASAVTANSNALSAQTRIYQTTFKSGEWSGDLKSFPLNTTSGFLLAHEWSAQDKLDIRDPDDRNIFTLNADGVRVPFTFTALDSAQVDELRKQWPSTSSVAVTTASDAFAKDQINYLRGETNSVFRDRLGHKLGDVVHSEPVYVAEPKLSYASLSGSEGTAYSVFRSTYLNRIPTVYLGANDGMLHAFDASTGADQGKELFAYIPSMLIPKLNSLTHKPTTTQDFNHKYFVDATPAVSDAYYASAWHSVLIGGLGGGGKGIYALDITTAAADEAPTVMWEFSDADDVDMGYSFSKPSIVKLDDGDWYAIFGNGYNSSAGKAVLYVVNLETKDFKKITSNTGPSNGLSTPTVIDTDGDLIADRVYAGDLLGNVWSFDITSFNVNSGGGDVSGGELLFSAATDQPITSKIAVQEHSLGALAGYALHFGTGKFFSSTDNDSSGQATQSIYAIWDCQDATACTSISRSDLLEQEIVAEVNHSSVSAELRVTSDHEVSWLDDASVQVGDSGWQGHIEDQGWYIDLYAPGDSTSTPPIPAGNHGERVVSKAVIFGHSILYSTLLPSKDVCDGGGSGWLMSLRAESGGRFEQTPFDINADGAFSSDDYASWTDDSGDSQSTAVSGVKSSKGIPSTPIIMGTSGGHAIAMSDHSSADVGFDGGADGDAGESDCTAGICGVSGGVADGRQSWIQLD